MLCITVWGWKLLLPICLKKRKKKKRKEGRGIVVQYHLSHPVHVTLRGERKVVAEEGKQKVILRGRME